MGYRRKDSYRAKSPEAKAKQLAGLKQFKGKKGKAALKDYSQDPAAFRAERRRLDNGKLWGECAEDWQRKLEAGLDTTNCQFAYVGMARGHDKTGGAAWRALHDLLYGPEGSEILFYAADEDQSRVALDALKRMIRREKLKGLKLQKNEVIYRVKDSRIKVETSDAASSFGKIPYRVYCDELHAWRTAGAIELWESLVSSTGKMPGCKLMVTTNAGWDTASICFKVRELAKDDPAWFYFDADGWLAGWTDPKWLKTMERTLSEQSYRRLILNEWCNDSTALTTLGNVKGCCCLTNIPERTPESRVALGIDLGLKHDLGAVCAVESTGSGIYTVLDMRCWKGSRTEPVSIDAVERYVMQLRERYDGCSVSLDPWQAAGMIERIPGAKEFHFTAANVGRLTEVLRRVVNEQRLRFWKGCGMLDGVDFADELCGLVIVPTSYGERLDHKSGASGKGSDRSCAVGIALCELVPRDGLPGIEMHTFYRGGESALDGPNDWRFDGKTQESWMDPRNPALWQSADGSDWD